MQSAAINRKSASAEAKTRPASKSGPRTSRATTKASAKTRAKKDGGKSPAPAEKVKEWELRMLESRKWGHKLHMTGGSNPKVTGRLVNTLRDSRAASESQLRRSAIEALVPAAAVGHRGALDAQATALLDKNQVTRRIAVSALKAAAGGKRPQGGGAVAMALRSVLPPPAAKWDEEIRRAGADALYSLAPRGDPHMLSVASGWLKDDDAEVRLSATKALGLIGSTVDEVRSVAQQLTDPDWRVSRAAIEALEKLGGRKPKGTERPASQVSQLRASTPMDTDPDGPGSRPSSRGSSSSTRGGGATSSTVAISALSGCCAGASSSLLGLPRSDALMALGRMAAPGTRAAVEAAAARLADTDQEVRRHAVDAVSRLAPGIRSCAQSASAARLAHRDFRVRASARDALVGSSEDAADLGAIRLAANLLEEKEWAGRRGAAAALTRLSERGADDGLTLTLEALVPKLGHIEWSVRRKAVQALAEVCGKNGDPRAVTMLSAMAADPEEEVRAAIVDALPRAAPQRSRPAVSIAAMLAASDLEAEVRAKAVEALRALCDEGRSRTRFALQAVVECLEDECPDVQLAAARALGVLGKGRRTGVDLATGLLKHDDDRIRSAAVAALREIVCGDKAMTNRARIRTMRLLRHPDGRVRAAAEAAMSGFCRPEESGIVAAGKAVLERLRRNRFEGPRGNALNDEENSTVGEDRSATSDAASIGERSRGTKSSHASQSITRTQSTQALGLRRQPSGLGRSTTTPGNFGRGNFFQKQISWGSDLDEELEAQKREREIEAAMRSSSEEELSESGTDVSVVEGEEGEEGAMDRRSLTSDATSRS